MIWTLAYVLSTVAVNALFIFVPPFPVWGVTVSLGSFLVGGTFMLRDWSQREIGHRVVFATVLGALITALMSPQLAVASGVACLLSALADWAVLSRWPGSFRSRVVASSAIGAPLDSILFTILAGFFSWPVVAVMTASKLVALLVLIPRLRTGRPPDGR